MLLRVAWQFLFSKHSIYPLKRVNSGSLELFLEYFKTTSPEKYRFLDYYQYCKSRDGFTSNFRQEAKRLQVALEQLVKNESDLMKQKAQYLLDVFEASIFFHFILITGKQYGGPC
jgi:hypothetical protein